MLPVNLTMRSTNQR